MKRFVVIILINLFVLSLYASYRVFTIQSVEGVPINVTYESGNTVLIGKRYDLSTFANAVSTDVSGSITIPSEVDLGISSSLFRVNKIGDNAFKDCSLITKITLPESLNEFDYSIGEGAFEGCANLMEINIPSELKYLPSSVFKGCESLTSITIPAKVTNIGSYAFEGCTKLTSLLIPNSVLYLGNGVFKNCTGLTSITIPERVTSIGANVFEGCTGLTSITIPEGVTSIGAGAFKDCKNLTSVIIPSSVTSIGANAFEGCTGLTSIAIPEGVTSIGAGAFTGCSGLKSLVLPNTLTNIVDKAFEGLVSLTSITLPSNLTRIGKYAFSGCTSLSYVNMNNCPALIDEYAFKGCENLLDIEWSEKIVSIERWAFENCSSLKKIVIPTTLQTFHLYAFSGCTGVNELEIRDGNSELAITLYSSSSRLPFALEKIYIGRSIVTPNYYTSLFENNTTLKRVELGGTLSNSYYYPGCTNLSTVIINKGVKVIDPEAFKDCVSIYEIDMPETIESIGYNAFMNCSNLQRMDLGSTSLLTIGNGCFSGCTNLKNAITSSTLQEIGADAFNGCSSLLSITVPEKLSVIGRNAFTGCTSLESFLSQGGQAVVPEDSFCTIFSSAFTGCVSLSTVEIPQAISIIEDMVFKDCSALKTITLPSSVNTMGKQVFMNCAMLESINLSNSLQTIDEKAFYGCNAMKSIDIPASVINIEKNAFENCSSLKMINLEEGLKTIGNNAFNGCNSLQSVEFPYGLESIGDDAFRNSQSLSSISIPRSVSSIGNYAFYGCKSLQTIKSKIVNPYTVYSAFGSISSNVVLYVTYGQKKNYEAAQGWPHSNIVEEDAIVGDTFEATFLSEAKSVLGNFTVQGLSPLSVSISEGATTSINSLGVKKLELPDMVTGSDNTPFNVIGIDAGAFNGSAITSAIIPKTIRTIGKNAFGDCQQLYSVSVSWRSPSNIETDKENFEGLPEDAVLYVPAGTKERYEALEPWNKFSQIIESSPISAGDISARFGSKADLPIYLKNTETVEGLQFKLTLPDGVSVVEQDGNLLASTTERTEGMTIMGRKDPDEENSYLFVVFSLDGDAISGTEGAILNVRLDIAHDMELGVHDIKVEDVYMTTSTFETLNPAESTSELTIKDFMQGDVNNDGIVNVTDAIGIVNHVLKNTPETFIEGAADVNQDRIVNVTDAIGIINMILNK